MTCFSNKNSCDYCKNMLPLKDGWIPCCKAFPDGIPREYMFIMEEDFIEKTKNECANGFKFDPDVEEQKKIWWE